MRRLIFSLAFTLFAFSAPAQISGSIVGTWYGEVAVNQSDASLQRWMRVNRADGTQTITFRMYQNGQLVRQVVRHDLWSLKNGVYRSECRSKTINGESSPCDPTYEYDVHRLDSQQMEYKSRSDGASYRVIRVQPDFKF